MKFLYMESHTNIPVYVQIPIQKAKQNFENRQIQTHELVQGKWNRVILNG